MVGSVATPVSGYGSGEDSVEMVVITFVDDIIQKQYLWSLLSQSERKSNPGRSRGHFVLGDPASSKFRLLLRRGDGLSVDLVELRESKAGNVRVLCRAVVGEAYREFVIRDK
jgi:hypothetical protein